MSNKIIARKVNEVFLKLQTTKSIEMDLYGHFAEFAENYIFHPKVKMGFWDGRIRHYDKVNSLLPTGLLPKLSKYCKLNQIELEYDFDVSEMFNEITDEELYDFYDEVIPKDSELYPRDYQHNTILKALTNKRGICRLATSAGKSFIQYLICRKLLKEDRKILFIVPNVSLVEQMYSDFISYGYSEIDSTVCKLHGQVKKDTINFNKPILLTTWQSLQGKKPSFFERYDSLICDETHLAAAQILNNISKYCVNCDIRIGLTGTMPANKATAQTIIGMLGPIVYDVTTKELIDRGFASDVEINNVLLKYDNSFKVARTYDEEMNFISSYKPRQKILNKIVDASGKGTNTLILVHKIDHLEETYKYLYENYGTKYSVYKIYGEIKATDRETIRKKMESSGDVLLVATYSTLSTGWSVKRLHNIVFYSSYKSKIKILQSIGRGLRKHESKESMILWDVVDDLRYQHGTKLVDNYIFKHFKARKTYYEEQGFKFTDSLFKLS